MPSYFNGRWAKLRTRPIARLAKGAKSAWGAHNKVTKIESTAISLAQPRSNLSSVHAHVKCILKLARLDRDTAPGEGQKTVSYLEGPTNTIRIFIE
jgi:hypothetical protein